MLSKFIIAVKFDASIIDIVFFDSALPSGVLPQKGAAF
ncbi:hypothetical protein NOVOSPHI9U_40743 [Novosphingobium sp. 9U]|nr:hypothetical protein NOVOSPHI9U_40743 [Novosphingobium sp. 9U]